MEQDNFNIFDINFKNHQLSAGMLLISNPLIEDAFFKRTVVLLIDYNAEGATGIVLNKPMYVQINDVVKSISAKPLPLSAGGPVSTDRIFFLHQLNHVISDSQQIIPGVYWSGNEDDISIYLKHPWFDENKIRPYLGYAGWTTGQLELEINQESWLVVETKADFVFSHFYEDLWTSAVCKLGPKFHFWLNTPLDPMAN